MSLTLRNGWRTRPDSLHPEVETLKELAGLLARFLYFAYLWLLAFALLPLLWGWRPVVVTSGSMSPSVRTGDVVVTMPFDGDTLGPGTVIVFSQHGKLVTHRVAETLPDGSYRTAGDANQGQDSTPVAPGMIEGVGRVLVPTVGLPVAWAGNGDWYPMAWFGVALIGFGVWVRARRGRRIRWGDRVPPSTADRVRHLDRHTAPQPRLEPQPARVGPEAPPPEREPLDASGADEAPDPFARRVLHDPVRRFAPARTSPSVRTGTVLDAGGAPADDLRIVIIEEPNHDHPRP